MKNIVILFITLLNSIICFSQQLDTLKFKSYYKISLAGKPQKAELIKFNDDSYKGYIVTKLDYSNRKVRFTRNRTWRVIKRFVYNTTEFLRKKEIEKEIIDTAYINSNLAKKLFLKLKEKDINDIKDCKKENNCKTFLDSDYTSFKIKNNEVYKNIGFEELYPAKNDKYLETEPNNRIEAQAILTLLDNELNFDKTLYSTIKRLPEGSYSYFNGYSIISMNSPKKK